MNRALETLGEVVANMIVFALAVALSTGLTCNPKVQCDAIRDEAAEVATP